jgi:hypothetical protein
MRLAGFVILGLITTLIVSLFFSYVSNYIINSSFPKSEYPNFYGDAGVWIYFLVIVPISFLIGSTTTGYFGYHEIETKWSLLWMVPALFISILLIIIIFPQFINDKFIQTNSPRPGFVNGLLFPIGMGLLWYLASLAGVFLGYKFREYLAERWEQT